MRKQQKGRKGVQKPAGEPKPRLFSRRAGLIASTIVLADLVLETKGVGLVSEGVGLVSRLMREDMREEGWSFLEKPPIPKRGNEDWAAVRKRWAAWTGIRKVVSMEELKSVMEKGAKEIDAHLLSEGKNPGDYRAIALAQGYALPCKSEKAAREILSFCKKATAFLYAQLPQLIQTPFEYVIIEPGKDYSKSNETFFIGENDYVYYRIYVYRKERGNPKAEEFAGQPPLATAIVRGEGCKAGFTMRNTGQPGQADQIRQYNVFVSNSPYALFGVPSEVIPRTTITATIRYAHRAGMDRARLAEETLVEGISTLLVRKMVSEFQVPNGHQLLKTLRPYLRNNPVYRYVDQSIDWMGRNGIERGLEFYMESPGKFLATMIEGHSRKR